MKLTGRTILITGGSAGIGLAFALKFVEFGNEVIVTGRRQQVLDEVKAKHPKLHTIQSDVADPAQIATLAARVKADFPKLDVLMNNAGIMLHKNLTVPVADLERLTTEMDINLGVVVRMTSALIDILTPGTQRTNGGRALMSGSRRFRFFYCLLACAINVPYALRPYELSRAFSIPPQKCFRAGIVYGK